MKYVVLTSMLFVVACSGNDWVAEVRAAQERSDQALAAGQLAEADEILTPISDGRMIGEADAEQARAVRQDAFYQRARIAVRQEDGAAAERLADLGLALGGDDMFTANLHVVRGQANEMLGRAVEAAADYHRALLINERLLDEVLAAEEGTQ